MMPLYDCGEPDCEECQRAFGLDRRKAIESYKLRCAAYERLEAETRAVLAAAVS